MTGTPLSSILLVLFALFIASFGAVSLKLGAAHLNRGTGEPLTKKKVSSLALILGGILFIGVGGLSADPPEILTHKKATFTSRIELVPAPLLEKLRATTWHEGCPVQPEDLRQLTLTYWNFQEQPRSGKLIVNKTVATEVIKIFQDLFNHGFLIEKMAPVEDYNGSDDASMAANNSSAFNCRDVTGQPGKFSNHSWGLAIDINPLTNPYVKGDKVLPPEGSRYLDRARAFSGSVLANSFIVERFAKAGWTWGGTWSDRKDYQHFEKPMPR